jgi:hypothetical protein
MAEGGEADDLARGQRDDRLGLARRGGAEIVDRDPVLRPQRI